MATVRELGSGMRMVLVAAVISLIVAACGSGTASTTTSGVGTTSADDGTSTSAAPGTTTETSAAEQPPIEIASIFSLTGDFSTFGLLNKQGTDAAIAHINANGGIDGRELVVEYFDDRSRPEIATALAEEIAASDRFLAVVGTGSTTVTAPPIVQVLNEAGVPTVSNIATASRSDDSGEWIFHSAPSYDIYALESAKLALDYIGASQIGVIHTTDTFGQAQVDAITANADELGVTLVGAESTATDAADATPALQRLVDAGAEAIIAISVNPQMNQVYVNGWTTIGAPVPMIGNIGYASPDVAGLAEEAVQQITAIPGFIVLDKPLPRQVDFVEAIVAAGETPQFLNAAGWDAMSLIAEVFRAGFTDDRSAVREGLESSISDYPGVNGLYTWSPDSRQGFSPDSLVWLTYVGGGSYDYYEPWAEDVGIGD